ncbi:MAG: MOSC domain-containing protein [Planctomycetota bacterium]
MTHNHHAPAGKLLGIAVRVKPRGEMLEHRSIEVSEESGLSGDFRRKPGRRQVTVMTVEAWEAACAELEPDATLPWTTRRANLLVNGVDLAKQVGAILTVGDVQLKVTGETDPCGRMDEYHDGLMNALLPDWRGGVCCQVITGGLISVGDSVELQRTDG